MQAASALASAPVPVPGRILFALGLLVLLAHAMVLRHLPTGLDANSPLKTRVFTTRSIQIAAVAPPVVRQPETPPVATPPRPRPRPKRPPAAPARDGVMSAATRGSTAAEPKPVPAPAPVTAPDPGPVAQEWSADINPAPETAAPALATSEPPVAQAAAPPASAPPAPADPAAVALAQAASAPDVVPASVTGNPPASAPVVAGDTPAPSLAYTIPGSIRLRFDATGKRGRLDYRAMGTLTWLHDGTDYDARLEMGDWIIGTRTLSSTGKLTTDGLAPRRFSDKFRSERAAHFDRQRGNIVFSANTPTTPLLPGAQDQISIFVQLAALVAGDPLGFPIGKTVSIQTVGPRDAETWVFVVEKEEMLHLPGGEVPALKLVRKPARDYSQMVELWLAPELAFLPARIRISFANGDHIDQQWRSSSPP